MEVSCNVSLDRQISETVDWAVYFGAQKWLFPVKTIFWEPVVRDEQLSYK